MLSALFPDVDVTVAAIVVELNPDAVAPFPVATILSPLALVELKSTLDRKVVTVLSPDDVPLSTMPIALPEIWAEVKVDTSMLRPSAAVKLIPPVVVFKEAVTSVLAVWAFIAVSICEARSLLVEPVAIAPILMPLI